MTEDTSSRTKPDAEQGLHPITLLCPIESGRMSVMAAFKKRQTRRTISDKKMSLQLLSNLLWAAFGVNRKKGPFGAPGRTAASASNSQEIDLYIALSEGVYLYEAVPHRLTPVVSGDLRPLAIGAKQGNAGANAPVRIIYVVDIAKFSTAGFQEPGQKNPEIQKAYYYVDTGLIAGNVAVFAASQGLVAWFHNCQKESLASKLHLKADQHVLFAQTVGYASKT
jgi:hypothetical protein